MMWIDLDGFIKVRHRAIRVALPYFDNSAVVIGHNVTAIGFHCLVEVRQRAIQITFIETEVSPVVPGHRLTRSKIKRIGVVHYCFNDVAARFISQGTTEECGSEIRCESKCDVVSANGAIEVALMHELVTQLDVRECRLLACLGRQLAHQQKETSCNTCSAEECLVAHRCSPYRVL